MVYRCPAATRRPRAQDDGPPRSRRCLRRDRTRQHRGGARAHGLRHRRSRGRPRGALQPPAVDPRLASGPP